MMSGTLTSRAHCLLGRCLCFRLTAARPWLKVQQSVGQEAALGSHNVGAPHTMYAQEAQAVHKTHHTTSIAPCSPLAVLFTYTCHPGLPLHPQTDMLPSLLA